MREQGAEPEPGDDLIWVVTDVNFWNPATRNVSSNKYKKPKFSAFLEETFDADAAIAYATEKWGPRPYGVVRLRYQCVIDAGFVATFKVEDGNESHLNLVPREDSQLSKKARARAMVECSHIVQPWGESS